MAIIRTLTTALTADTRKFRKGMKSARGSLSRFKKAAMSLNGLLVGFGGALTIRGLKNIAEEFDAIGKTSDKLGVNAEKLQVLQEAARVSGNSVRNLDLGLQRMTRRVAEAAQGTGEAKKAIKELGLDAVALANLTPDEQFLRIADAMSKVKTQSDRVRLGFKLFDSEGVGLINTLKLGRTGLEAIEAEMVKAGRILDRDQIKKLEEANDAWTRLARTVRAKTASMLADIIKFGSSPDLAGMSPFFRPPTGKSKVRGEIAEAKREFAAIAERERKRVAEQGKIVPIPRAIQDRVLNMDLKGQFELEEVLRKMRASPGMGDRLKGGLGFPSLREEFGDAIDKGEEFGVVITAAFNDAIFSASSFLDILKAVGQQIASIALNKAVFAPIGNALGEGIQGAFNWEGWARGLGTSASAASSVSELGNTTTSIFVPAVT